VSDQTFEQLWKKVQLYAPNCPTPLAQEFVNTAYSKALTWDRWTSLRQEREWYLPPVKQDGLVDVTQGSTTVTGVGTSFAATDLYRQFMVEAISPMYTIMAVDVPGQTLTLDRAYGRVTATSVTYEIGNFYLEVPSDFLTFDVIKDIDQNWKLHTNFQQKQIDVWDTKRQTTGTPWIVAAAPWRTAAIATDPPVRRYELWPRLAPGPKTYSYRYIRKPPLMVNNSDRPIWPIRGDALRKGALAELALWPGTDTAPNKYYSIENHGAQTKQFNDALSECWKDEQDTSQTAILYEDWEGVPYAPIDARYLQSHDVF
jgi:hypothetical protein